MSIKKSLSILLIVLLTIIGFQNCSQNGITSSANTKSDKSSGQGESGTPYEGKIYGLIGSRCPDKTEVQSRIVVSSSGLAQMNRNNCTDITPVPLAKADVQVSSDSSTLTFKNQNFNYIATGSLQITKLSISNDAANFFYSYSYEGQPSWLQIFLDTDNNPATGFSYNGIGADFLIENDNVWVYAAPKGSPPDTWAWNSVVLANKNQVAPNISWSFARSAIGSPSLIKLIAQTSLGAKTDVIIQTPK